MGNKLQIIQDISLLYELSLAVGRSVNLQDNCHHFLNILLARKNLSFASVVLFNEKPDKSKEAELVFALPSSRASKISIPYSHIIFQKLNIEPFFSVDSTDPDFNQLIQEKSIERGIYTFFKLRDIGFLKLYDANRLTPMNRTELNQLRSVIDKFAVSIKACLAFQRIEIAERRLQANEKKLREVINSAMDAVIIIDVEGNIQDWNHQAEMVFGYSKEEVQGNKLSSLIIPERYQASHQKGMEYFKQTRIGPVLNKRLEISALHKSGREFDIELTITHIDLDGKDYFSSFIRDITQRKNAENALIRAKREAEQARLAEQQFLANMSHEIRTPMNAVIGMTHLLYETPLNEEQKEYLDALKFSGDSLLSIINNILDLSKIEAGELAFESRPFNLKELIHSITQTFHFKLKNKNVSLNTAFDPLIQNQVIGDSTRLNQIMTNLLSNAMKFTEEGTIGIKVTCRDQNEAYYKIEFEVSDTGIGIPPEKLPLIFENFKQAEDDTVRKYGGTGLGLPIVKQLIELQQGWLKVESEPGEGSRFTFQLQFPNTGILADEKSKEVTSELTDSDEVLAKLKILVAEDNLMNQKLITKVLEIWETDYALVVNGREAIKATLSEPYQVILMDINMPELDGVEATRIIRENKENPNHKTPIIALTAAALLDEKNRALAAGMDDFLTKPFSPKALKKALLKWTQQQNIQGNGHTLSSSQPSGIADQFAYLYEFSDGDEDFVKDMLGTFLTEAPTLLAQLHTAYQSKHSEDLYRFAHRLKPSFMMLGLTSSEAKALKIEELAKAKELEHEQLPQLVEELAQEVEEILPVIKSKLTELEAF